MSLYKICPEIGFLLLRHLESMKIESVSENFFKKYFAVKEKVCTFAPAKVCIALARCYQYPDKERLNLQTGRSKRFFLSGVGVRVAQTLKKKQNIFKLIII